jgi:tetratricopeptide (TPR) repeat protein
MNLLLPIVFNAVFIVGQTPPPWESLSRLGNQHQEAEDFAAAGLLRREALRLAELKLGVEDKQLAPLLANLAQSLHFEGHDAEAEPLARRAYLLANESGDRKLTGVVLNTFGIVLAKSDPARAEPLLRRSVALLQQAEGADSLDVAKALNNLATLYTDTHQYAKAEQEMTRALPIYEKYLATDDPLLATVWCNMFRVLYDQHRFAEGEPYLRRALAIGEKKFPRGLKMVNLQLYLAALEASRENFQEAARILEQIIPIQERLLGAGHPQVGYSLVGYSRVLRGLHQKTEAKKALNRANLILKVTLNDVK